MFRILIAEDDPSTARLLCAIVKRAGYEPLIAADGVQALEMLDHNHIDLLLCDVMMPRMDGFTLTRTIRESGSMLPILMLTAKDMPQDKHTGFIVGTDDYMTKPFYTRELLARIAVHLRTFDSFAKSEILTFEEIKLNIDTHIAQIKDVEIKLTRTEYAILKLLMQNQTQVVSKSHLLDHISEDTPDCTESSLKTHISNLRKKLRAVNGKEYIEAVWGIGFKMKEE